jgi:siroheme synthase-like protein
MKAFPISWVTTGRKLLIVGGGHEADVRLRHALLFEWVSITVVMPQVPAAMREIAGTDTRVVFREGDVTEDDVRAADFVFEDSGRLEVAQQLRAWCDACRVPLNATDKPDLCDCYYMSMLIRDPLLVCIGSGGQAPAIASALRRYLDARIGPGWVSAAKVMSGARDRLPSGQVRFDLLRKIARHPCFLDLVERNDVAGMQNFVEHELRSL